MRRRYVAALAVAVPVAAIWGMKYLFPVSYDSLTGYMLLVALVFKSALLSFWAATKLKVLAFLKGLTLVQGFLLLLKRWFLDNVFARWLKQNIVDHIAVGVREFRSYYSALKFTTKLKNILLPMVVMGILVVLLYLTGNLSHILIFTEIKLFVISISKSLLVIAGKIFGFVADSWLSPILEVFALSYLFSWLERILGKDNWLVKMINSIGERLNKIILYIGGFNEKYIDPLLNEKVSNSSKMATSAIKRYVHSKKVEYEYEQFERLEKQILDGHIGAYYSFEGMDRIKDKKRLYALINQKSGDHLDIIGYISRNGLGGMVSEDAGDNYYHDIFLLEGVASSKTNGVDKELEQAPDSSDFWVLNTSKYSAHLCSRSGAFECTFLPPHSVILIKTIQKPDLQKGDVYGIYEDTEMGAIAVSQDNITFEKI